MESTQLFLRGLSEIVEPLNHINNHLVLPYLGKLVETTIDVVRDFIPRAQTDSNWFQWRGETPSLKRAVVGASDIVSTIHPNYLLVAASFVFVFIVLYIKMKYPFWNQVPALHIYDWHRRFLYSEKPYIVHSVPKKTKYWEPAPLIQTKKFRDLREDEKNEIVRLLQNNYLPSDRVFCSVQLPDLAAQCSDAAVSMYNQVVESVDTHLENHLITKQIQGFVTSRRIQTSLSFGKSDDRYIVQEPANYIDYLCFTKSISSSQLPIRRLFHTHEYNERMCISGRQITLFKKEVELCDAIVPLVEYEAITFYLRHRIEPRSLPTNFQMVRIQREHLRHLHDWMERIASLRDGRDESLFKVSITAEIGNLIHLLQTNQMFAYALRGPDPIAASKLDTIYAIYFFRNAHMKYEDLEGGDTLHSVCAFCNTDNFELYFLGFVWAVREARKDLSGTETKMLMMDDIGHLRGLVTRWRQTHDVVLRTKCAYYFCNYIVPRSPYDAAAVNILL
jgi:hypothetical protein